MKLLLATAFMGAVAALPTEVEMQAQFVSFMKDHNKTYVSADMFMRYNNFKNTLAVIEKHNSEDHTWRMGVTQFADLTPEEFKKDYASGLPKELVEQARKKAMSGNWTDDNSPSLPPGSPLADLDWVSRGAVNPVRNQASCGSCWAFAAVSAVESAYQIKKGTLLSMSEQNLVDCDKTDYGCNGGLPINAFNWIKSNGGVATRAAYPYLAKDSTCYTGRTKYSFSSGSAVETAMGNEASLLTSVNVGPVAVGIQSDPYIMNYVSGVYSGACGRDLDHAVVVVGYGTSGTQNYWKVRNSWGSSWGEGGYFRLIRDKDECGIADLAARPVVL